MLRPLPHALGPETPFASPSLLYALAPYLPSRLRKPPHLPPNPASCPGLINFSVPAPVPPSSRFIFATTTLPIVDSFIINNNNSNNSIA